MKKADLKKYKMFGGRVTILQLMFAIGLVALVATLLAAMAVNN
jgi:hypothetical protein